MTLHVYYHEIAVVDAVEEEDTRTAVVALNPCIVAELPALDTEEEVHSQGIVAVASVGEFPVHIPSAPGKVVASFAFVAVAVLLVPAVACSP